MFWVCTLKALPNMVRLFAYGENYLCAVFSVNILTHVKFERIHKGDFPKIRY